MPDNRNAASTGTFIIPKLITIDAFTKTYSVGRTTTYRLIGEGLLETVRLGRRRLIKVASVETLFGSGTDMRNTV